MQRVYDELVTKHLGRYRQMIFLAGPRQVGKTTLGKALNNNYTPFSYINWDVIEHRQLITAPLERQAAYFGIDRLDSDSGLIFFDEIHKYNKWKSFLKGFFDIFESRIKILVSGSARLTVYQRGGDSLMGRYFYYRMHPLSTAELVRPSIASAEINLPQPIESDAWDALCSFGGFPEPYSQGERAFWTQWKRLRRQQLFQEDLRDLSRVQDIGQLELLAELIRAQTGQLTTYTELAKKVNVTIPTVQNWLQVLRSVYYLFAIKPWSKNVSRSLIKEPKYYMWDWSIVDETGARHENMVACHLLKAVHFWTDLGLGEYDLFFLRDKDKREVDFLVTKNQKPWFLVEVKSSNKRNLSPALAHFQRQIGAEHAFQVTINADYVEQDCFAHTSPIIVPARTFLSQLV